jgi:hypothetical protein
MANIRPNFIYVGAPKAGSSWLFRALSEHPDIFVSREKSTTYFEADEPAPLEDYLAKFAQAGDARAIGEVAHDTFLNAKAARRIHEAFPEMRIICCLREPGDFARSAIQWWSAHTDRYGETAAEMLAHERMTRLLDYPNLLAPFFDVFPQAQIKVLFFDDLQANPGQFLAEIFEFLEVAEDFRPSVLDQIVNQASRARYRHLTHLAYGLGGVMRRLGFGQLVEWIKQRPMVERLLYAPLKTDETASSAVRLAGVSEAAQPKLDALEDIIGRPVPAGWRSA